MGYEERLHGPVKQAGIPPQRAVGQIERAPDIRRGPWLTPRLVLLTLTIILLGAGAGVVGALVLPKTYTARAEILYTSNTADQDGDPLRQDRALSTQLVLLKNRAVLGPIAQKQGRRFADLAKDVDASVVQNSTVIQVEVTEKSEPAAVQTLQAVVDGYLALARQPSTVARNLAILLTQARQNTAQLQAREKQLIPEVLAGKTLQSTLDDTRAQLTASLDWEKAIQTRINEVGLTGQAGSAAQVLTPPYVLPEPTIPRWLSGGLLGTLVGVIVAGVMLTIGALRVKPAGIPHRRE
jgi:uncharacterized protein involved in exopolysaccharide biosynthesis